MADTNMDNNSTTSVCDEIASPTVREQTASVIDATPSDIEATPLIPPTAKPNTPTLIEDAGPSDEDRELEAQLAALQTELHDVDAEIYAAIEESHSRDNAEERVVAARSARDEAVKAHADAQAITDGFETRAATRQGLADAYATLRTLEDYLHAGDFTDTWAVTVDRDALDALLREQAEDGVDASDVGTRIGEARRRHETDVTRVRELRDTSRSAATELENEAAQVIDAARKELDVELRRLATIRGKLRTTLNEQRFHLKRGSHIKPKTVARRAKDEYLELEQQKLEHDKISESINEEEYQSVQARRALEDLDREHKHLLRTSATEKATLLRNIEALSKEHEAVDWELMTLMTENTDLRDMRRNMIRAQAQIRQQLRQ